MQVYLQNCPECILFAAVVKEMFAQKQQTAPIGMTRFVLSNASVPSESPDKIAFLLLILIFRDIKFISECPLEI